MDMQTLLLAWLVAIDPAVLTGLKIAAMAILGDTLIGWIFAATKGEFDIRQMPRFLQTSILPYLGVLLVLAGLTAVVPDYKPVFYFICTIVSAKFGIEALKDKLMQFFKPANEPPAN